MMNAQNPNPVESDTPKERQISLFHIVIVCLSLLMTIGAYKFSTQEMERRTAMRFENSRDQVLGLITDRMEQYGDILWAGASAVESHGGDISLEGWRTFVKNLRIDERYPGINGIAVIHHLTESTMPAYLSARQQERPGFSLRPPHDNPVKLAVSFIEPEAANAKAIGFDLASETNRRNGVLASRDSGQARITGPITLVQDAGKTPGFLFSVPFYDGLMPDTVGERQEKILGFVNAAFVTHKLMEGLLAKDLRDVRFSIMDAGQTIYDEHAEQSDPLHDPEPMFSDQVSLDLYGRTWSIDMRTNLAFRDANSYAKPTIILMGGLLIEGLIIALLLMLTRANRQAIAYANQATSALKGESQKLAESNKKLSGMNEELEQFAYITSHDLKTPIRGIGSLTEMVQDDLDGYLSSPDANPDVGKNLERIAERVRRMNDLTRGVMEMSRIGKDDQNGASLTMEDSIEALQSDFALEPDQITLSGAVRTIHHDTLMFHRILENIVGNAVKYHDGKKRLHISIATKALGDRNTIAISDNGPGIDPDYHDRIFEIFQTLHTKDSPESTGIGLAMVKRAVERNDGQVRVISSPGEGATFSFDWPGKQDVGTPRQRKEAA